MKKTFIVSLKYWDPVEGTAYFTTDTPEEARENALKLFSEHRDVEIIAVEESPISQLELDINKGPEEFTSPEDLMEMLEAMGVQKLSKGDLN